MVCIINLILNNELDAFSFELICNGFASTIIGPFVEPLAMQFQENILDFPKARQMLKGA